MVGAPKSVALQVLSRFLLSIVQNISNIFKSWELVIVPYEFKLPSLASKSMFIEHPHLRALDPSALNFRWYCQTTIGLSQVSWFDNFPQHAPLRWRQGTGPTQGCPRWTWYLATTSRSDLGKHSKRFPKLTWIFGCSGKTSPANLRFSLG